MRRFVVRNRAPLVVTAVALVVLGLLGTIAVRRVLRESATSRATVLALLEEEGRGELLAGSSLRALAYFQEASRGGESPALRFMRATALREIATAQGDLDCGGVVRDLSFSPDGTLLVASCHDRARVWRLADRAPIATLGPAPAGFDHLTYAHDGKHLVTWGDDGVARLWDAASFALARSFTHSPGSTITFATFTPDDARVATTGADGWARIWNVATGAMIRPIRGSDALILHHLYGLLGKDDRLLTFTIEGLGADWDINTGEKVGDIQHGSLAFGGDLAPDGTRAATCGMNRLVKVWDTTSPQLVWQLAGATDAVVACKFSPSSKRLIGTAYDGHAYVWDLATGAMIAAVDHGTAIWTGHFSPDGERFVTVGVGGTLKRCGTRSRARCSRRTRRAERRGGEVLPRAARSWSPAAAMAGSGSGPSPRGRCARRSRGATTSTCSRSPSTARAWRSKAAMAGRRCETPPRARRCRPR